ncbi:FxLD family lanthipeptide [Streptomyces sp. B1866]|uniref:FxLD family lanthipeptide n=1 Tax=Streptomyces sp. B1866 TaxID=3075431 RepID=UPI00288E1B3E|nr:FxLD family lanthipeptide [Streptomyces sp. B1866]MDT3396325.1 FxLD family lanthipeptide [Streptomyces sp. B1866]
MAVATPGGTPASSDFDIEFSVVEQGPIVPDLVNDTSDNCTSTCESACSNSTCE